MARYLILAVAALVILGDGYVSGRWGGRWEPNDAPAVAAEKIKQLPPTIGDWQGGEDQQLDDKVVRLAGFSGYVARQYTNRSGVQVNLLLACGRPGPLAVHTPEVCYGGQGYSVAGDPPDHYKPDQPEGAPPAEFWKVTFTHDRRNPDAEKLRVLWSWNRKGVWGAPASPRWTFAGAPVLYKVYVSQPYNNDAEAVAALDFVKVFLPEFERTVAPDR
jgi:Protein of unknown function (DUF3485)